MNYNIDYVKFYSFRRFPVLQKVLGGRRFWGSVLSLAIPIAVQNLLTSSFTLVDTLMVGQLGDVSLAAVGMAGQWSWFLNMVSVSYTHLDVYKRQCLYISVIALLSQFPFSRKV